MTGIDSTSQPMGALRPAAREKMRDRIVSMLVDAIRSGVYDEGDKLPSERDLATQLGVSRAIVSDAIDKLQASGVLASRRGRGGGTFVVSVSNLPTSRQRIPGERREVMAWLLEAREAVEVAVVSRASARARVSDLREMRAIHEQMAELTDDPASYAEAAMRFNLRVAEASGNPFLMEFVRILVNEQATLRKQFSQDPAAEELRDVSLTTHAELLDSLADGDPDHIARAVAAHIDGVRRIYFGDEAPNADDDELSVAMASLLKQGRT